MVNSKCAIVSRGASASSVNLRNGTVKGKADDLYRGLCNPKITAEPLYNTPLFIGPYAAANNTALLA